ncbi:MAG: serine/threonine protein kinase [Vicinamibacteria bacterium]|nr:serine/threonine protein kinase [Vicinamibacteria bacterium]
MIKHRFVLDEAARSFLDLTARTKWTDVRLSVGGRSLGPPLSRADLRDGQSYTLPDGSELLIQLEMPFLMPTLRIERDGVVVQGSDASLERLSARAGGWLMGLGGLNFLLGLFATSLQLGPAQNALFLVGVFFALCGFFARRGSLPGLVLGTGLFFLGVLQGLSTANTMTIVFQIALLTPMFRALHAHYLERTSATRPLRRDHVPLAVVKSVIRPQTQFAQTIAPASRPRVAAPDLANGAAFDRPAVGPATSPPVPSASIMAAPEVRATSLSDQRFGPYVVTGTLGSGGMATVYQARQTSIGRDVALKVITGNHNADPEFGERFRREAETTARLSHPHILKVFDFGEDAGRPYLAMEYMGGGTLRGRIGATPLPVPQVLKWAEQIGPAIHSAHSQGVVHRDIKPENVLLDQSGNAFLADFGLARLGDARANLTQAGTQMGSPSYMAPEQWHGADVTEAADLYAFAAMVFELLAGRPPFRAASLPALMAQHLTAPVPSARALRPSLPLTVDAFFAKALNKAPEQRFADASAMVDGLKQALKGGAVTQTARPRAPAPRPIRQSTSSTSWVDHLRSPVGIAVAVIVGLVAAGAWRQRSPASPMSDAGRETGRAAPRRQATTRPTPEPVATVAIPPATLAGNLHNLPFRLTDAAFSRALNRLVVIAEGIQAVMIVDPETGNSTRVDLPATPHSVTTSPEGFAALVTSDFSVSMVNLASGTVDRTVAVNVRGSTGLMGSWAYILPERDQWEKVRSVNLLSGEIKTGTGSVYAGAIMKAHPSGRRLYMVDRGLSPGDIHRIDAGLGPALAVKDSRYHGDYPICENLWFSEKGDFAFTGCGNAFSLSDDPKKDMDFAGTVPNLEEQRISALAHSDSASRVLLVPQQRYSRNDEDPRDTLVTYEFPGFRFIARDVLPRLGTPESPVIATGRFVFANRDGRRMYVVLDAPAAASKVTSAILAADMR